MKIWGLTIDDSIQYPDNLAEAITERWRGNGKDITVTPEMVIRVIDGFPEKERYMLFSKFCEHLTLEDIGKKYGVSVERARQIISGAVRRIMARTVRL